MPMMERVIDTEMIVQIGFVVSDAPYKSQRASQHRLRWGLVAFEPRGALDAIRHLGGSKAKHPAANLVSNGPPL